MPDREAVEVEFWPKSGTERIARRSTAKPRTSAICLVAGELSNLLIVRLRIFMRFAVCIRERNSLKKKR
jgi:hypothetical protein